MSEDCNSCGEKIKLLKGPRGPKGERGERGERGPIGATGAAGADGNTGNFSVSQKVIKIPGSGNYTVPENVNHIVVEMWGGGAGAAAVFVDPPGFNSKIIAGGGAGSYVKFKSIVIPGQNIPYTVGNGGLVNFDGEDTIMLGRTAAKGLKAVVTVDTPNSVVPGKAGVSVLTSLDDELISSSVAEVDIIEDLITMKKVKGADSPKGGLAHNFSINSTNLTVDTSATGLDPGSGGSSRSTVATTIHHGGGKGRIIITEYTYG